MNILEKLEFYLNELQNNVSKVDSQISDSKKTLSLLLQQKKEEKEMYEYIRYSFNHLNKIEKIDDEILKEKNKIAKLMKSIRPIQIKMQNRDRIKAKALKKDLPTKKLSDYRNSVTEPVHEEIDILIKKIENLEVKKDEEKKRFTKLSDINWNKKLIETKDKISSVKSKIILLEKKANNIKEEISETNNMINMEKVRDSYIAYAEEHYIEIDYDEDDVEFLAELIKSCNIHRQNWLLEVGPDGTGYHAETRCWKQCWFVGHNSSDDEEEGCEGFFTGRDNRCGCGVKWYWNKDDFDPYDLDHLTIESNEPYGYISKY